MKYYVIFCFFCLSGFSCASQNLKESLINPFDTLNYTHVNVYKNLLHGVNAKPPKRELKKGKALTKDQINNLIDIVGDTATYGSARREVNTIFESFDFIFFSGSNEVIGQIAISYNNNYLLSNPFIPASIFYKQAIGNDTINLSGFSDSGRLRVQKLLTNLGINVK